jgi:ABC-type transport system substrate-binding protein
MALHAVAPVNGVTGLAGFRASFGCEARERWTFGSWGRLEILDDPASFFGSHFAVSQPQFGFTDRKLFALVRRADAEANLARRGRLYRQASRRVMQLLPIVPYVYFTFPLALRRNVTGFITDPSGPIDESSATVGFASK